MIPYATSGQLKALDEKLDNRIDDITKAKEYTYAELLALAHSNGLVAGQKYRITDFVTTILERARDTAVYKSAEHPFDIILTAKTNSTFHLEAQAALHEGDEYFKYTRFEDWTVMFEFEINREYENNTYEECFYPEYIIDSYEEIMDTYIGERHDGPSWMPDYHVWYSTVDDLYSYFRDKYPAVDAKVFQDPDLEEEEEPEEGYGGVVDLCKQNASIFKGRIVYLKDEFNNSAAYDFKNIMCSRNMLIRNEDYIDVLADRYYYLFDAGSRTGTEPIDASVVHTDDIGLICNENSACDRALAANNRVGVGTDCGMATRAHDYRDIGKRTFCSNNNSKPKFTNNIIERSTTDEDTVVVINNYISNVRIDQNCTGLVIYCSAPEIHICNGCSDIYLVGSFNGPVYIGSLSSNIKVRGIKNSITPAHPETTSTSELHIDSYCKEITLGDMTKTTVGVSGYVSLGTHSSKINIPCSLLGVVFGAWSVNITADPIANNKLISLQKTVFDEHCENITFKLADARGAFYQNIHFGSYCSGMIFDQNNTGKGTCQNTSVQNIIIAPGTRAYIHINDAHFDPVSGSNANKGETYFGQDAAGDYIMWWHSAGITVSGKKWNSGTSSWDAI